MRVPRTVRTALVAVIAIAAASCVDTPAITSSTDLDPSSSIHKITVEPSKTAVVAGPLDLTRIMPSYDAVYAWCRGGETDVQQIGQNIALYKHGAEMEVGIEVDRPFAPVGDVIASELPGGRVAAAVHTTGYGDLRRTYAAIEAYLAANGLRGTGLCWEIYGDPDEHGHVDVEIRFLLEDG